MVCLLLALVFIFNIFLFKIIVCFITSVQSVLSFFMFIISYSVFYFNLKCSIFTSTLFQFVFRQMFIFISV